MTEARRQMTLMKWSIILVTYCFSSTRLPHIWPCLFELAFFTNDHTVTRVQQTKMVDVIEEIEKAHRLGSGYITTVNGHNEEWRIIGYPNFDTQVHITSPRSWKYVSSEGRLLNALGDFFKPTDRPGYQSTSIKITKKDTLGDRRQLAIHLIVAYTFLGNKPSKEHTIDHINGNKTDNRLCNYDYDYFHYMPA